MGGTYWRQNRRNCLWVDGSGRNEYAETSLPRKRAAAVEECRRAYGETVKLTVPLMPLMSAMLADMV